MKVLKHHYFSKKNHIEHTDTINCLFVQTELSDNDARRFVYDTLFFSETKYEFFKRMKMHFYHQNAIVR